MAFKDVIIGYLLVLKMLLTNLWNYVINKIYATKSVLIIRNDKIISVYWRYIVLYWVNICKCIMLKNMYEWCCDKFDVSTDTVQIILNVNYVNRYVIFENKDSKHALMNTIKYINIIKPQMQDINIPPCIMSCNLKTNNNTINIKELLIKYSTEKIRNYTIKGLLQFNQIPFDTSTILEITMFKNGRQLIMRFLSDILDKQFIDLW